MDCHLFTAVRPSHACKAAVQTSQPMNGEKVFFVVWWDADLFFLRQTRKNEQSTCQDPIWYVHPWRRHQPQKNAKEQCPKSWTSSMGFGIIISHSINTVSRLIGSLILSPALTSFITDDVSTRSHRPEPQNSFFLLANRTNKNRFLFSADTVIAVFKASKGSQAVGLSK